MKEVECGEEAGGIVRDGGRVARGEPTTGCAEPAGQRGKDAWCRDGEAPGQGQGGTPEVHAGREGTRRAWLAEQVIQGGMMATSPRGGQRLRMVSGGMPADASPGAAGLPRLGRGLAVQVVSREGAEGVV